MLRSFMWLLAVFLGSIQLGCAGLTVSQQPRLEIPESARVLVVRPQGVFATPQRMVVTQRPDGTVAVHTVSKTATSLAASHAYGVASFDATLVQLDDALLPFLFPACQVSVEADPR